MNTTQLDLSKLAKSLYFKEVTVDKYRLNFLRELNKRTVVDKRLEGFHCCHCAKLSKQEVAFSQTNRIIFPFGNKEELWIVNSHYDGCRGWD
jgi:hypothetical protein